MTPTDTLREAVADDDTPTCFICLQPFKAGDMVLPDMSGEVGHLTCFGTDREGFVKDLDTGEPLGPDDPLPNGYRWSDPRLDATVRGEEG